MKIKISNFRGIKEAEFEPPKIAAIFADNHAGKTSLIQALQAALTGETIPLDITKKQISMLVHSGSASGLVQIEAGESNTRVIYPEAKLSTAGTPPKASGYAAGLESILTRTTDRPNVFAEYLKTLPTKDQLINRLKDPEMVARIWETIEAQGWDAAFSNAKEKGARLKGQWEMITGENWGVRKAESWTAPAYDNSMTKVDLEKRVQDAREWLEAAISFEAVSEAEIERLESESKGADELIAERQNLENLRAGFEKQKIAVEEKIAGRDSGETVEPCPHCNKEIVITAKRKLKKWHSIGSISETDIQKFRQDAIGYQREMDKIDRAIAENSEKSRRAADAMKKLEQIKKKGAGDKPQKTVEDCRKELQSAEEKLKAVEDTYKAETLKNGIAVNKEISEVLAPSGLRAECLKRALSEINGVLRVLCDVSGWELVEVQDDLSITYNGMILGPNYKKSLCSESEYYRAEIILQIAFAMKDNSDFILIDRADLLDKSGRNGLFRILGRCSKNVVVAFTWLEGRDAIPDLSKIHGAAYWIEKGVLHNGK